MAGVKDTLDHGLKIACKLHPDGVLFYMSLKQWVVYLLRCSDNTLYCGVTNNIERRVREHNMSKRGAKYTRSRRPVCLVGFVSADSRSEAQKLEYKVKKMKRVDKLAFFK